MNKHTPGPWGRNIKPARNYPMIYAGRDTDIAQLVTRDIADDEAEANADLIAAAPELLEALREMVEIAELTIGWLPTPPGADGPIIQARAAIAKATRAG